MIVKIFPLPIAKEKMLGFVSIENVVVRYVGRKV